MTTSRSLEGFSKPKFALTVPSLRGNVTEAVVTRWLTTPLPSVSFKKGEPLVELSSGDIVRGPFNGFFVECGPVGKTVKVGDELARIDVDLMALGRGAWGESTDTEPEDPVVLGNDLDPRMPVRVKREQLCSGCYILGVQGMGKSSLLEQIVCQPLDQDESVIVFDPHGQLIDNIVVRMPANRLGDTYHLDLKDRDYPFGLNVFACANPDNEEERDRTRNQVTHAFEKLWPETRSGVYFKKLLRHVIILLIDQPQLTLADVPRLLRDEAFRARYAERLRNTGSRDFWRFDYGALVGSFGWAFGRSPVRVTRPVTCSW